MLKLICVGATLLLFTSGANAAVFQLPLSGTVPVYGNFAGDPFGAVGEVFLTYTGGDVGPETNTPPFYLFSVRIEVNDAIIGACGDNQEEALCQRGVPIQPLATFYPLSGNIGHLNITTSVEDFTLTPLNLSLFIELQPDFSLNRPVPEPSTWAMLILGFVGIGLMTYRRRKSAMLAA
jgi:hypothetical protein